MAENIKALGSAAGLSPSEQKRIDEFYKSLTVHKELSNLPKDAARAKFSKLTAAEQADLTKNFGNEDPTVKPQRGFFGTAWHYTGGAVAGAIGTAFSKTLAGLQEVSDFSTRVARTALSDQFQTGSLTLRIVDQKLPDWVFPDHFDPFEDEDEEEDDD